jgi:hypothetical protein
VAAVVGRVSVWVSMINVSPSGPTIPTIAPEQVLPQATHQAPAMAELPCGMRRKPPVRTQADDALPESSAANTFVTVREVRRQP